jgi:acetolactate synthase regulatory subunit
MENEKKLEALVDMFQTKGWQILVQMLEDQRDALEKVFTVKDERDLYTRQGQLTRLYDILTLPAQVDEAYRQQKEGAADGNEDF